MRELLIKLARDNVSKGHVEIEMSLKERSKNQVGNWHVKQAACGMPKLNIN